MRGTRGLQYVYTSMRPRRYFAHNNLLILYNVGLRKIRPLRFVYFNACLFIMLLFHYLLLLRGIKYVDIPREKYDVLCVYNALCFITSVINNNKK